MQASGAVGRGRHAPSELLQPGAPCGLVAAVQHVGDVVDLLGAWGGVAGGRAEVDVPEPCGDGVYGHAGLETVGGPVGTQRVRVAGAQLRRTSR
jgi:hypothetical protein